MSSGRRSQEHRPLLAISSGSLPNVDSTARLYLPHDSINNIGSSTPHAAHIVPRRSHSLHNNAVFALASAFLLSAFSSIYLGANENLINLFFFTGALCLTHAFAMLTHWSIAVAQRPWSTMAIIDVASTFLKVPSGMLLMWQPITAIATGGPGCSWSNMAGISALSILNTVNSITMPILFWQRGRVRANLPIFGAWLFAVSTFSMNIAIAAQLFQPTFFGLEEMQAMQFGGAIGYEIGAWMFLAWGFTGIPLAAATG